MTTALREPTLSSQCLAEFLGTALLIFFGTGCVAALKVAGASFGLWEMNGRLYLLYRIVSPKDDAAAAKRRVVRVDNPPIRVCNEIGDYSDLI